MPDDDSDTTDEEEPEEEMEGETEEQKRKKKEARDRRVRRKKRAKRRLQKDQKTKEQTLKEAKAVIASLEAAEGTTKDQLKSILSTAKADLQKILSPQDSDWIHKLGPDDLAQIKQRLKSDASELQDLQKKEDLADSQVVARASAGCLLRGMRKEVEGWVRCDTPLVSAPEDIEILGPETPQFSEEHEFYEGSMCDRLSKSTFSFGKGVSGKFGASDSTVMAGLGIDYRKEDEAAKRNQKQGQRFQYAKSHVLFVPTAACNFCPNQLTGEAIDCLKGIESLQRLSPDAESSIKSFLSKFGSHVTKGTVHFGGLLITEASYECTRDESLDFGKSLVATVLDGYLRCAFGILVAGSLSGSALDSMASTHGTFTSQQLSKVKIMTKKIGGPTEVNAEHLWRNGLAGSNRTWSVIKLSEERLAVWDLIVKNAACFENPETLAHALRSAWERDNDDSIPTRIDKCENAQQSYRRCVANISNCVAQNIDATQWSCYLKDLVESISEVERYTGSADLIHERQWTGNEKLKVVIEEFFKQCESLLASDEVNVIRSCLGQILRMAGTSSLPEKQRLKALIDPSVNQTAGYQCFSRKAITDTEQLVQTIRDNFLPDMRRLLSESKSATARDRVMQVMQPDLTIGVRQLLQSLYHRGEFSKWFSSGCVLAPMKYNFAEDLFTDLLTPERVTEITDSLDCQFKRLNKHESDGNCEFVQVNLLCMYSKRLSTSDNTCFETKKYLLDKCRGFWTPKFLIAVDNFIDSKCRDWLSLNDIVNEKLMMLDNGHPLEIDLAPLERVFECSSSAQQTTASEDIDLNATSELRIIVEATGLIGFWPQKISLSDVIQIGEETGQDASNGAGLALLKRLIMADYNFRDSSVVQIQRTPRNSYDDDAWSDDYVHAESSGAESISLAFCDVLLACFISSDRKLQQIITERLFDCKLAIPLAYSLGEAANDKFLHTWSIRSLVVRHADKSQPGKSKELILDRHPFPIVSFIRLGTSSFSKSAIANICINRKHDTFTVSNSSSVRKTLSNGSIELAWLLPHEGDQSALTQAVCILNLRGDALLHSQQREFLISISSCLVVVLPDEKFAHSLDISDVLWHLYSNAMRLIVLATTRGILPQCLLDLQKRFKTPNEKYSLDLIRAIDKWNVTAENSVIAASFRMHIDRSIQTPERSKLVSLIEVLNIGHARHWKTDEGNGGPIEIATDLSSEFSSFHSMAECKCKILPLQGDPCHEISRLQKKRFRLKGDLVGDEKIHWVGEIDREIWELRQRMAKMLQQQMKPGSHFLMFLKTLHASSMNRSDVGIFLRQFALNLNSLSLTVLPELREAFLLLCQESLCSDTTIEVRRRLLDMEAKLQAASFGLEHFFRELAQMYETIACNHALWQRYQGAAQNLAGIAANLLCQGHAIEIIDGDSSSVATRWLEAVFRQVESQIGQKHLLVVSVLGVQSSGKSTMLNTMFGLQFPVSAGRCTRGAFLQLVRNQPEKSHLNVDYIAVIDTEGLRHHELGADRNAQDNELATMVIGLADVVLINIKGENLQEVSDVLQIVAVAFVRMKMVYKNVHLKKRCMFIHQDVSAVDAKDRMSGSSHKLLIELNEVVEAAASKEGAKSVKRFVDLIAFDPNEDVSFWPNLWEGSPPRAPVSPDYCRMAQTTRGRIVKQLQQFEQSRLTFDHLAIRIRDLWDGVLKEDFVFSFRNTLEMKAYGEVEGHFGHIVFTLEGKIFEWVKSNGVAKVRQCNDAKDLSTFLDGVETQLSALAEKCQQEARKSFLKFLSEHELKLISNMWEATKLNSLSFCVDDVKVRSMRLLRAQCEEQRVLLLNDGRMEEYKRQILTEARQLANEMKGKRATEQEEKSKFDEIWLKFISQVSTKGNIPWRGIEDAEKAIKTAFTDTTSKVEAEIHKQIRLRDPSFFSFFLKGTLKEMNVLDEHFTYSSRKLFKSKSNSKCAQRVVNVGNKILGEVDASIHELSLNPDRHIVNKSVFNSIISTVKSKINDYNKTGRRNKGTPSVIINYSFSVWLSVHACSFAQAIFKAWYDEYQEKHGLAAKLSEFKTTAFQSYRSSLQQATKEVIATDLFIDHVKKCIANSVDKRKAERVLRSVYGDFEMTKLHLITRIMESLANNQCFDDFKAYITNSKSFAQMFLTRFTHDRLFTLTPRGELTYYGLLRELIEPLIKAIKNSVHRATMDLHEGLRSDPVQNLLFKRWVEIFCLEEAALGLRAKSFAFIDENAITDPKNFEGLLLKKLDNLELELLTDFRVESAEKIDWHGEAPYDLLLKGMWGCPEQCPFCGEPCSNRAGHTELKMSHHCIQHRPAGVTGTKSRFSNNLALSGCNYDVHTNETFNCGAVNNLCKSSGKCSARDQYTFHKYKDYKSFLPDWHITPDASNTSSPYWMWFMSRFKAEIEQHYQCNPLHLPESWGHISVDEAKSSLAAYHPSVSQSA